MSQASNCPEYRLARSDSKDPATTCQGLKANGQRCRRTVASAKSPLPETAKDTSTSVETKKTAVNNVPVFCWQHQDQAVPAKKPAAPASRLRERSSIETLVERVGLMNVSNQPASERKPRKQAGNSTRTNFANPTVQIGDRQFRQHGEPRSHSAAESPNRSQHPRPESADGWRRKSSGRKLVCFVTRVDDDEDIPVSRVRPRPVHHSHSISNSGSRVIPVPSTPPPRSGRQSTSAMPVDKYHSPNTQRSSLPATHRHRRYESSPLLNPSSPATPRQHPQSSPQTPNSTMSQTQSLLAWIPQTLSPKTTSKLLQKLSEPFSKDEEPGYIYLCWVTPMTDSQHTPPSAELASSLIPPPRVGERPNKPHRTSDIMRSAGISPAKQRDTSHTTRTPGTIILKIGRTANVHGRLNQWSQQCAHHLTLMRYYPYAPSNNGSGDFNPNSPARGSAQSSPMPLAANKIPTVHRVESLVLTELSDLMVPINGPCSSCGKRHKEWFEVRAEKEQLRAVDECVRRWVRWSQIAVGSGGIGDH